MAPSNSEARPVRRPPRRTSTNHFYHTFPTPPPKSSGRHSWLGISSPTASEPDPCSDRLFSPTSTTSSSHPPRERTPLPTRQLFLLAILSLLEQTALNSIAPYLPEMVEGFPGVPGDRTGLYVGLLASSFALAQLATNLFWGYLSDEYGRKPVLLAGMGLLGSCFLAFGFCVQYWQAVLVHIAMGMLNGNAAVVPAVFGELTDRSNQTTAFKWLPVLYTIGAITGPAVGGLLVRTGPKDFPYLVPNVISAVILFMGVGIMTIWFEETRPEEEVKRWWKPEKPRWISRVRAWMQRKTRHGGETPQQNSSWSSGGDPERASLLSHSSSTGSSSSSSSSSSSPSRPSTPTSIRKKASALALILVRLTDIFTVPTAVLLITLYFFHLSLVAFNSLFPIFAAGDRPTGRNLTPGTIGLVLSISGCATVVFQLFLFEPFKRRVGNLGTYRASLLGFALSMFIMPWVSDFGGQVVAGINGRIWEYVQMCLVLVIKNMAAVAGLASVMLLVTNSAPSTDSLGTLNGVAYTLAAAGRSFGPFLSGGLFTIANNVHPKGEVLAWGVFGGLALVGWACTLAMKGDGLESDDYTDWHDELDAHDEES